MQLPLSSLDDTTENSALESVPVPVQSFNVVCVGVEEQKVAGCYLFSFSSIYGFISYASTHHFLLSATL